MLLLLAGAACALAGVLAGFLVGRFYAPPIVVTVDERAPAGPVPGEADPEEAAGAVALSDRALFEREGEEDDPPDDPEDTAGLRPYGVDDDDDD